MWLLITDYWFDFSLEDIAGTELEREDLVFHQLIWKKSPQRNLKKVCFPSALERMLVRLFNWEILRTSS